ncbi:MAG TPA: hypothetical protein VNE58_11530 [Casimicrobiaceae bacterium]|nr:hypothetical protein [Casimicrobiaceae bacterium]
MLQRLKRWIGARDNGDVAVSPPSESTRSQPTAAQAPWLASLRDSLGMHYQLVETSGARLLSSLETDVARVTLDHVARTQRRILRVLDGIARPCDQAISVVVFDDEDAYYRYAADAYDQPGEYATSGGMFFDEPYPHLITVKAELATLELVIAHELTHAALHHLPLPLWLNEGLAVNTEQQLTRKPPPLYTPQEMDAKHRSYWTPARIQQYWSGAAFHDTEAQMLAYDLARILVEQLASDWQAFAAFARDADARDGGSAAAVGRLGVDLGECVCALLGRDVTPAWSPASHFAAKQ